MIYFDNAASSYPKPSSVSRSVKNWLDKNGANPGRSGHKPSLEAAQICFDTRVVISQMFGLEDMPENIIFVPNATIGLNTLILGLFNAGDHVITTDMEHNSVLRPLYQLSKKGVSYSVAKTDLYDDNVTVKNILSCVRNNTAGIVVTQCSNVCGKIMPVSEIAKRKPAGIKLIVDGSQGAGTVPVNISKEKIDYYCAPSHKGLLGPQGSGFIAINSAPPRPLIFGGTGSNSLELEQPDFLPDMLESGTLETPVICGFYEGLRALKAKGIQKVFEHKLELTNYTLKRLSELDNVILYNKQYENKFVGVVCFNIKGYNSDEIAQYLARHDICVRSGLHCAPLFHKKMGTTDIGMVRISFSIYNTKHEIDYMIKKLKEI